MLSIVWASKPDTTTVIILLCRAHQAWQVKNAKLTAVEKEKRNALQAKEALWGHSGAWFPVEKPSVTNVSKPIWVMYESAEMKQLNKTLDP